MATKGREWTIAQVAEAQEKCRQRLAPRYDAHVVEYERYDPMFLALGITVPYAKRPRVLSPAVKAASAKRYAKMMENHRKGRRLKDIVREQNIGRTNGWFGPRLVRG